MTSQRDETTHVPAGEEMTDDPIIIERRDETLADGSLGGDGPAGDVRTDSVPAGDGLAADETAGDELTGRHAAPDTGGADPAPLVVPPEVPRADTGGSYGSDPVTGAGPAFPGSAAADSAAAAPEATAQPGVNGTPAPSPVGGAAGDPVTATAGNGVPAAALSEQQWPAIQAMFVDDPKGSVTRAAAAAEEVAKAFVASLQREQAALRASWENGGDTTTEDLRTVLQQYRAFCSRLEGLA